MNRRRASSTALILLFPFENVLRAQAAPYVELPEPAGWPLLLGGLALLLIGRAGRAWSARRSSGALSGGGAARVARGTSS